MVRLYNRIFQRYCVYVMVLHKAHACHAQGLFVICRADLTLTGMSISTGFYDNKHQLNQSVSPSRRWSEIKIDPELLVCVYEALRALISPFRSSFFFHPLKYKHTLHWLYLGPQEKPWQSMALSFPFPFSFWWATVRSLALKESTNSDSFLVGREVSGEWTLPRRISVGSLGAVGYMNTGAHTHTHTHTPFSPLPQFSFCCCCFSCFVSFTFHDNCVESQLPYYFKQYCTSLKCIFFIAVELNMI